MAGLIGFPCPSSNCCPAGGTTITVGDCSSSGYPGVTVSVYTSSGGTLLDSGVTDGAGRVSLSIGAGPTWWVTVTGQSARFNAFAETRNSTTISFLGLVPATGYHCLNGCRLPVSDTLTATLSTGIFSPDSKVMNYNATSHTWVSNAFRGYALGLSQTTRTVVISAQTLLQICSATFAEISLACPPSFNLVGETAATIAPPCDVLEGTTITITE
jgi:hypothetical protein